MKKTTIGILSFFVMIILATACKKDYSCKCTGSYMGISADTTISLGKMTKKDAKSECNGYTAAYGGIAAIFGATISCNVE